MTCTLPTRAAARIARLLAIVGAAAAPVCDAQDCLWSGGVAPGGPQDGAAWSLRATTGPYPRWGALLSCDVARGRTVLYGGQTDATPCDRDDTWEWDGRTWVLAAASGLGATGYCFLITSAAGCA